MKGQRANGWEELLSLSYRTLVPLAFEDPSRSSLPLYWPGVA